MKIETITVGNYSFKIRINPNMPDYSKHPFFVKKLEEFDAFMEKNPKLARGNKRREK